MNQVRREQLDFTDQCYGNQYGPDLAQNLDKGMYFEVMPMILLLTSLGLPDKIQDGNYKGMMTSKWFHGESTNRLDNPTYELEITLENYTIVGWRDLK